MSESKFEQWCLVEIMGHQSFAGYVTEQALGGASFIRVDVPEVQSEDGEKREAFSKLFGASSIYCITPVTEEVARSVARRYWQQPLNVYMPELFPRTPQKQLPPSDSDPFSDRDDDDDDLHEPETRHW